jgi:hypothetical protein
MPDPPTGASPYGLDAIAATARGAPEAAGFRPAETTDCKSASLSAYCIKAEEICISGAQFGFVAAGTINDESQDRKSRS